MNTTLRSTLRTTAVAVRTLLLCTLVLGLGYTLLITGIGQLLLPARADGSPLRDGDGQIVGSTLIGQSFLDQDGEPLPEYFQPRPSAAGDGYDGRSSSGTNHGPENPELIAAITERRAEIAEFNDVAPKEVPADALTASSSGLDPHISPEYAALQTARVAEARGLSLDRVEDLVAEYTEGRDLGYLGDPTVNVAALNLALDELED
ncbi:potassium-transporting ATPase subunit KdpC [Brachybacterium halotolerans subsp. kimchii]|uniref:potassium-transporting ATPase subunit KdpC n=1 Tax=Micrococcales TaxID=85006 RepID=UPI0007A453C9|nr:MULTISPECIES: potassium-transporting ATPase subunit KdpC [Micrococcales]MCZ4327423.1 potassium-transporting ATPase subunit KdpC [Brachybacterium paraconglomeratum]MDH5151783.1 potassium-transporting ATPase subunit KdpC [Kocuria palustris]UEJ82783.1 potassium-transporting ATPase subunit KdpC [Brachybacterium halotolerans subsp. kimchii]